jgi:hypothetical protein
MQLVIDNSNVCRLDSLRDNDTGELIDNANVSVTIYDGSNVPILGTIWPVNMPNKGNGVYEATLDHRLILDRGRRYRGVVTAIDTQDRKAVWELELLAQANKVY